MTKTFLLVATTILLFSLNQASITLLFFSITLCLLFFINKKNVIKKRLNPLMFTVIFIVLFQLIFNQSLSLTSRLELGIMSAIRIFTASTLVLFYTTTTSPSEILRLFRWLPKIFQLLITITLSTIPAVFEEAEHISRVQKTRGAKKTLFPIFLPLFHLMFQRAEHLTMIILTRGYSLSKNLK